MKRELKISITYFLIRLFYSLPHFLRFAFSGSLKIPFNLHKNCTFCIAMDSKVKWGLVTKIIKLWSERVNFEISAHRNDDGMTKIGMIRKCKFTMNLPSWSILRLRHLRNLGSLSILIDSWKNCLSRDLHDFPLMKSFSLAVKLSCSHSKCVFCCAL